MRSVETVPVEEILETEHQISDFILDGVHNAGGAMLYSRLTRAFHHGNLGKALHVRYEALQATEQRKQIFKDTVQALVNQDKLVREGQHEHVTLRLSPHLRTSRKTEQDVHIHHNYILNNDNTFAIPLPTMNGTHVYNLNPTNPMYDSNPT